MFFVFVRILPIGMGQRMPKKRTTGQNIDAVQNFLHLEQIPEPLFPISGGLLVFILVYILGSLPADVLDPHSNFCKGVVPGCQDVGEPGCVTGSGLIVVPRLTSTWPGK